MTTKLLLKQQRILEERRKQAEQDAKDKGEGPPKPEAEDPNAAELTDSQNRKQTLKSPKMPLFIGLSRICPFHFAAILRLS